MPGPVMRDPTPEWLKPSSASVTDSALTKALRMIGSIIGADSPTAQVMGLMTTGVPSAGAEGGVVGAVKRLIGKEPITAYHGSPHDFDQFSMEKIGTGEGAQAYGHGLYFAEAPEVAKQYRDNLAGNPTPTFRVSNDGGKWQLWDQRDWKKLGEFESQSAAEVHAQKVVDAIPEAGRMYEVNIHADPADFLDWDKPLSQQSEKVRDLLGSRLPDVRPVRLGNGQFGVTRVGPDGSGKIVVGIQGETPEAAVSQYTGSRLYEDLADSADAKARGSMPYSQRKISAAETMRKAGIPGIKYLDQGSRAAGEGSRNYVVFDDAIVEILKKYGLVPPMLAPMAMGGQSQETQR